MPLNTKIVEFTYTAPSPIDSTYIGTGGTFAMGNANFCVLSSYTTGTSSALNLSASESLSSILYCVPSGRIAKVIPRKIYVSRTDLHGGVEYACLPSYCYCCSYCMFQYESNGGFNFTGTNGHYYTNKSKSTCFAIQHGTAPIPMYNDINYNINDSGNSCTISGSLNIGNPCFTTHSRYFAMRNFVTSFCGRSTDTDRCVCFIHEGGAATHENVYLDYKAVPTGLRDDPGLSLADSVICGKGGQGCFQYACDNYIFGQAGVTLAEDLAAGQPGQTPPGVMFMSAGECINISLSAAFAVDAWSQCGFSVCYKWFCGCGRQGTWSFGPAFIAKADTEITLSYLIIEEAAT